VIFFSQFKHNIVLYWWNN